MPSSRRDWLLQQLGITPWVLRRPAVLQGEIAIVLPDCVRLVMVAETRPSLNDSLIKDVLRSLSLKKEQVLQITPVHAAMLPPESQYNSWRLGVDEPLNIAGAQLVTPALDALYHSGSARQSLWRQICEHEKDFFPEG